MPTETSVIIPKHDNDYARTDIAQSIFETFVFYVSTHFGGCSVIEGKGFYKMSDTSVQCDEWWKVSITYDKQEEVDACIQALINTLCKQLSQQSVMVTYTEVGVMFAAESKVNGKDIYALV